jgi:hypothetical protein
MRARTLSESQRREFVGQPGPDELEDALRLCEVLQPMLAEIAELRVTRQRVARHIRYGAREHDLPAVRRDQQPCDAVDGRTE